MWRFVLAVLLLAAPTAVLAEWKEAKTKNFLIYSEGSEAKLRDVAAHVEKYDVVLRWAARIQTPPSPMKLKMYLMQSPQEVQATLGEMGGRGILGYYDQSPRGPYFVGLQRDSRDLEGVNAQQVLFHEYAHHFMYQYFPAAYPSWYSEGFAEYYGTTRILEGDVIETGHLAEDRYGRLRNSWYPLKKMLTAKSYADVGGNIGSLYAQGWLLVHYLAHNQKRAGQLDKYLSLINAGRPFDQATNEAFGPEAKALNSELYSYARRIELPATRTPFKPIDVGPIAIRTLSPAEQALLKKDITLSRGLLVREAPGFAKDVRAIVRRFAQDPYALSILVEAERAAGNNGEAAAAVESWLAVQPNAPKALMHKAEMQVEALAAAKSTDKQAWEAARRMLLAANKASPYDPAILEAYYDSFTAAGELPPPAAQNALFKAFKLVPQVMRVRYKLAADFELRGMIPDAINTIKPAAFALHQDDDKSKAEKRREARLKAKYKQVGVHDGEEPWEMLARLEAKLAKTGGGGGGAK